MQLEFVSSLSKIIPEILRQPDEQSVSRQTFGGTVQSQDSIFYLKLELLHSFFSVPRGFSLYFLALVLGNFICSNGEL